MLPQVQLDAVVGVLPVLLVVETRVFLYEVEQDLNLLIGEPVVLDVLMSNAVLLPG